MNETWFVEKHTRHAGLTLAVQARLFESKSEFQTVEVLQTPEFGKMLLLDGAVMLTERDEFVYHEMLVHPALFAHPKPERVLIIGGGDGGSVREALKHASVKKVTLVEIDGLVVETCRKYFPALTAGLDDPRAEVLIQDGFAYLDGHQGEFDVILVDSTDPVNLTDEDQATPAAVLFTPDFYRKIKAALRPGGLAAFQSENPFYSGRVIRDMHRDLRGVFKNTMLYLVNIPTYPGGYWSFTVASDQVHLRDMRVSPEPAWTRSLRYFQPAMFPGILVLPRYVEQLVTP